MADYQNQKFVPREPEQLTQGENYSFTLGVEHE